MFKIAKSRVIQLAEQKLRAGDREGALALLRQAEAADRPGAFTAKEIKGLHDDPAGVLGTGGYGVVRERFYGGEMLPAKEMETRGRGLSGLSPLQVEHTRRDILDFNTEGLTSPRIADFVRHDPHMRALGIHTPQYFGHNAYNMVGQTARDLRDELAALKRSGSADKMPRQSRNRIAEISQRLREPLVEAHQVQPMSRLPAPAVASWNDLSSRDQHDVQRRFNQGMEYLSNRAGFTDEDKILVPQHNVRIGAVGPSGQRPIHLFDFGLGRFEDPDPTTLALNAERDQLDEARRRRMQQRPAVIGNRR